MATTHEVHDQAFGLANRRDLDRYIQEVVNRPGVITKPATFRRERWGTAAPTTGTWRLADVTWNTAPNSGGFMGWVCINPGTPGTWTTFGPVT